MDVYELHTRVEDRITIGTQLKRVSVIIPFSRLETVGNAIRSVLAQDYPQELVEIIVVGKGSRSLSEAWPMIRPVDVGPILQPGRARNLGAARATGEVLLFLDDDCEAQPGWIEANLAELDREAVGAVGGKIAGKSNGFFARCVDFANFGACQTPRRRDGRLWTASFAIRRDLFEETGGFNEDIRVQEDIDFCFRLNRMGLRTVYQPMVEVLHNHGRNTLKDLVRYQWFGGRHAGLHIESQYSDLSLRNRMLSKVRNPFIYAWLVLPFAVAGTLSTVFENVRQHPDILVRMPFVLLGKISCHVGIWYWCWRRWMNASPARQQARRVVTYSLLKGRFKTPRILTLFVTSACNARCSHCFYAGNLNDGRDLSLAEIEKLSLGIGPLDKLLISGGEPFLRRDLVEICRIFLRNNDVGAISIPTNGTRPHETYCAVRGILEASEGRPVIIAFSIDGTEQVHDLIRGTPGAYRRTIRTYHKVRSLARDHPNLILRIVTTVTRQNRAAVRELFSHLPILFPGLHSSCLNLLRGTARDPSLCLPSIDTIRELYELKVQACPGDQRRLSRIADRLTFEITLGNLVRKTQVVPCEAGRILGVVDHDGAVRPCELLPPIGNLRKASFAEIWNSVPAREARARIEQRACGCTHECYAFAGLEANPLQLARILAWRRGGTEGMRL